MIYCTLSFTYYLIYPLTSDVVQNHSILLQVDHSQLLTHSSKEHIQQLPFVFLYKQKSISSTTSNICPWAYWLCFINGLSRWMSCCLLQLFVIHFPLTSYVVQNHRLDSPPKAHLEAFSKVWGTNFVARVNNSLRGLVNCKGTQKCDTKAVGAPLHGNQIKNGYCFIFSGSSQLA